MKNLIYLLGMAAFCFSCDTFDFIEGMGPIVEEELEISSFEKISNDCSLDVYITEGSELKVVAIGHQNIIDRVRTSVINDEWTVDLQEGSYRDFKCEIHIEMPNLTLVKVDGSGDFDIKDMNLDNLHLHVDGSGSINMNEGLTIENKFEAEIDGSGDIYVTDLNAKSVDVDIDGSGDITLRGSCDFNKVVVFGSGDFRGFALEALECEIKTDASGDCEVNVNEDLEVEIKGSGDVFYKGNPVINQIVDGSGRLINAN